MSKVVTWGIVLIVIVGGLWYFLMRPASQTETGTSNNDISGSQTEKTAGGTGISTASTNAAFDADLKALDTQLQAATDASASAGQSDTPIAQTE